MNDETKGTAEGELPDSPEELRGTCAKCREKPRGPGHHYCRPCSAAAARATRAKYPERYRERQRERRAALKAQESAPDVIESPEFRPWEGEEK